MESSGDAVPVLRPILRSETAPARIMNEPRQTTIPIGQRAPLSDNRSRRLSTGRGSANNRRQSPSHAKRFRHVHYVDEADDYFDDPNMRQPQRWEDMEYMPGGDWSQDTAILTAYSFTPSFMSRATSTHPSMHADDVPLDKTEDTNGGGGGDVRMKTDHAPRLSYIFDSQYNGDHTFGGLHGANLTAVLSNRLKHQSLFRWLYVNMSNKAIPSHLHNVELNSSHCTRTSMDFDDFCV